MTTSTLHRRGFLAAGRGRGHGPHPAGQELRQVLGANDRIGVAFLGVGGRCQQHIDVILQDAEGEARPSSPSPSATCGTATVEPGIIKGRGLYPSAKRCGLDPADKEHVTKDYRTILDHEGRGRGRASPRPTTGTPGWPSTRWTPARTSTCEKPMTKTIAEAHAVVDAAQKNEPRHDRRRAVDGRPDLARPPTSTSRPARSATSSRGRRATTATASSASGATTRYEGHDPQDDRLGHVARAPTFDVRRREARADAEGGAVRPGRVRPSGAATGRSAAACSPTCSSTRRRT